MNNLKLLLEAFVKTEGFDLTMMCGPWELGRGTRVLEPVSRSAAHFEAHGYLLSRVVHVTKEVVGGGVRVYVYCDSGSDLKRRYLDGRASAVWLFTWVKT